MKKNLLIYLAGIMAFNANIGFALERNTKLGSPTQEELTMTNYSLDPTASAVVLASITDQDFSMRARKLDRLIITRKERIKVLTSEGVEAANVNVKYYDPEETNIREGELMSLTVKTYNLVDGKVVCTTMKKKDRKDERIDSQTCMTSFTAPDVRPGSIIEYEYTLHNYIYFEPETWYAQGRYPVFFSSYSLMMPDWFTFTFDTKGECQLQPDVKHEGFQSVFSKGTFAYSEGANEYYTSPATRWCFYGSELPALKSVGEDNPSADERCTRVEPRLWRFHILDEPWGYFCSMWEYGSLYNGNHLLPFKDPAKLEDFYNRMQHYMPTPHRETYWHGVVNVNFDEPIKAHFNLP